MRRSIIVKVTAFLLCVISLISAALSVFAFVGMMAGRFYTRPLDDIREDALYSLISSEAYSAAHNYHYSSTEGMDKYASGVNLYFEIKDSGGNLVYTNYNGQDTLFSSTHYRTIEEWVYTPEEYHDVTGGEELIGYPDTSVNTETAADTALDTGIIEEETAYKEADESLYTEYYYADPYNKVLLCEYEVTAHLPAEYFTTDRISFADGCIKALYGLRYGICIIGGASALVFIISLVILCCAAGWKRGKDKPVTCVFDKIPFDIFTAIYAVAVISSIAFFCDIYFEEYEFILFMTAAIIVGSFVLVSYLYSFAARAKTGELFKNTVIWWILKSIYRACRFVLRGIGKVLFNIPLYGKTILILAAYTAWTLLLLLFNPYYYPITVILWLFGGTIVTLLALYITYGLNKLKKGGESIAGGNYSYRIDPAYMLPSLKKHAESLNSISLGMSKALEERLKSERFKTELITNVSHDLKTPLTSIVNYIDLLKTERASEEPDEGRIDEYIEVLDRQSERLRKLTADLVEASKASTGNLEVNPLPVELGEMITQTQGEYAERLSSLGLELIVRLPSEPITIMADGKHLWRIFDNLMSNIAKYAMTGTRVYIDVSEKVGRAYIIFRNTSRYELNISADELTERFVRGDASRHTEGSGLGLSIARSLAELGGGKLDIYIDGDLFKVVVSFDCLKKPPKEQDNKKDDTV